MTREKGKIEWRTKKRLLYKDHKRIAGCKRHFTVKSSWVLKRKSTRLLVTLRQNEGCPSRGIPEVLLSWAFVVANVPENDIANGTHTHARTHTRSHAHTHTHYTVSNLHNGPAGLARTYLKGYFEILKFSFPPKPAWLWKMDPWPWSSLASPSFHY